MGGQMGAAAGTHAQPPALSRGLGTPMPLGLAPPATQHLAEPVWQRARRGYFTDTPNNPDPASPSAVPSHPV